MKNGKRILGRLLRITVKLSLLAGLVAAGLYQFRFKPVPVTAHIVRPQTLQAEVMGTGTLQPRVASAVSAKIAARIVELKVDQNDRIKADQPLALLDDGELRRQTEMAQAALKATKASLDRAGADITRAEAVLAQARAEHERMTVLQVSNAVTPSEMDKSRERLDVARSELARTQAARTEIEHQVAVAEQTLAYHNERLAETRLVAPFDALVTRRLREVGDVVVPGSSLLEIVSLNEVWVSAWVDESALAALAVDQPARAVFRSESDRSYPAKVVRLARRVDGETRELLVDVGLAELPRNWAVGQRAEVYIRTAEVAGVLAVPQRLIQWDGDRPFVHVDRGGRCWRQYVTLGMRGREMVEVKDGLRGGDAVIVARDGDNAKLRDGRGVVR